MSETRFIFLGAGNMAEAMARGLVAKKAAKRPEILMCDVREERLRELAAEHGFSTTNKASEAIKHSGVLVISVKPQALEVLADEIRPKLDSHRLVVSILAGVTLQRLHDRLGGGVLVRVMPNTPALVGKGASAYALGEGATEVHGKEVEALLKAFGSVVRVEEEQMNAVTALSGSGPAYVFLFMEALQQAAVQLGLDEKTAAGLAAQTIAGAAEMVLQGKGSPEELRKKVTSPGGTTEAALNVFEADGFRALVEKALTAARDRGEELGK